jgi:cytochrome b involved in lipid metabolism
VKQASRILKKYNTTMAINNSIRQWDARREAPELVSSSSATKETSKRALHTAPCGACLYCSDICHAANCVDCDHKVTQLERSHPSTRSSSSYGSDGLQSYTMCEIRRHNTADSCWLLVGDTVYDATSYMAQNQHPGGVTSILKRSGGAIDCTLDFNFHSKRGKKLWQKYRVGKLCKCRGPNGNHDHGGEKQWWMFWA